MIAIHKPTRGLCRARQRFLLEIFV